MQKDTMRGFQSRKHGGLSVCSRADARQKRPCSMSVSKWSQSGTIHVKARTDKKAANVSAIHTQTPLASRCQTSTFIRLVSQTPARFRFALRCVMGSVTQTWSRVCSTLSLGKQ